MKRWLLAVACMAAMPLSTGAAEPNESAPAPGPAAQFLSRAGLLLFARAAEADPNSTPARVDCIKAIPFGRMAPTYQRVLMQELPATDRAKLDAFFSSSAGDKWGRAMIEGKSLDEMNLEELKYLDNDIGADTVNRMLQVSMPSNPRITSILQPAMRDALEPCLVATAVKPEQ